jgi:hypothetical protein
MASATSSAFEFGKYAAASHNYPDFMTGGKVMIKQLLSFAIIGVFLFAAMLYAGGKTADAASASSGFANSFEYCRVSLDDPKSNLNVRTFEGRVIGKLRHGTRVWVNEYSGEWARVSVKKGRRWTVVGWVDSEYLVCD